MEVNTVWCLTYPYQNSWLKHLCKEQTTWFSDGLRVQTCYHHGFPAWWLWAIAIQCRKAKPLTTLNHPLLVNNPSLATTTIVGQKEADSASHSSSSCPTSKASGPNSLTEPYSSPGTRISDLLNGLSRSLLSFQLS